MSLTLIDPLQPVSEIVRSNFRTADVFTKYGINYCCGGQFSLADACSTRNIDYRQMAIELEDATRSVKLPSSLQFSEWKLDFLADYILNVHHAYLKQAIPSLESVLNVFVAGHKGKYPELIDLQEIFTELTRVLMPHIQHEDEIIFPYIKQIDAAHRRNEPYGNLFVKTLRKPLTCIEIVHDEVSGLLLELKSYTRDFNYPDSACTNHQVIFHKLREFYDDLQQHMHLENNLLYPKAKEIELHLLRP
jgi:regulator of cell morphogenesis and NO signaling